MKFRHLFANIVFCMTVQPLFATTYQSEVFANTDRTITIKNPQFVVGGQAMPVSDKSDLDGICSLHGLQNALANGVLASKEEFSTVSLGRAAQFNGFVQGHKIDLLMCHFWPPVNCGHVESSEHIVKRGTGHPKPMYIDTTVKCFKPWVGTASRGYAISYDTDVNSLCKQIKFHRSSSSVLPASMASKNVQLDNNGVFFRFTNGTSFESFTCNYSVRTR